MYKENCKLPYPIYKLDSQDLKATKELMGVTKLNANKASQFLVVQDSTANSFPPVEGQRGLQYSLIVRHKHEELLLSLDKQLTVQIVMHFDDDNTRTAWT